MDLSMPPLVLIVFALAMVTGTTEGRAPSAVDEEPASLFCRLTSAELRERVGEVEAELLTGVVAVDEADNGYRFWFEATEDRLLALARFVHFESVCCPFLSFEMALAGTTVSASAEEPRFVSLRLSGPMGTREFLAAMAEKAEFDLEAALAAKVPDGR